MPAPFPRPLFNAWNTANRRAQEDYWQRMHGLRCRHCSRFVSVANPVCIRCQRRRTRVAR